MSLFSWCGFDFIGRTFGEESCLPELGDPPDFQPSILVDGGITYISFFKKLLIPPYARIENVRKGCYMTVDPKAEKCAKRRETFCERRCRRRERKKLNSRLIGDESKGEPISKGVAAELMPQEKPKPERPSERSCHLDPKKRCSPLCRDQ